MERHPRSNANPPQLTVTVAHGVVVIMTPAELDHDATDALVRTVGAAVTTGETVMLDLEPGRGWDPDRWPRSGPQIEHPLDVERHVTAIGPGFVRIATGADTWTLDVARRRFCRSATPVDPRFVEAPSWTAIRAVWITGERTTVLTAAGTYVSAPSAWTTLVGAAPVVAA
jgi:hypothetical protein